MGPARLQRTTHNFLHYYDLEPLYQELHKLDSHLEDLNSHLGNSTFYPEDLDNYKKASSHIRNLIQDKLDNVYHTKPKIRNRRAYFNQLGATIKLLTGNLDETDGERINKILSHLETNQGLLQNQMHLQYSLNNEVIQNFNRTVQNIIHKENTFNTRIDQLLTITQKTLDKTDTLFAKDIYNQLIIIYNSILTVLQDIENSLTFCKLKTLHPSIITPTELFNELEKISKFYNQELPIDLTYQNIFDFEKLIEVNCHIEETRIIYILSLPINFNIDFDLYYLLPVPTYVESTYATIIPRSKYILKSKDIIKPLSERCILNKPYQCPSYLLSNTDTSCEYEILFKKETISCELIKLELDGNKIELISEINQFLVLFKSKDKLIFYCDQNTEGENIEGIYLVDSQPCKVSYNNNELSFKDHTIGKPLILKDINLKLSNYKNSNSKINIKTLKLEDTPLNNISYDIVNNNNHLFYLVLCICLILCPFIIFIFTSVCYILRKNKSLNLRFMSPPSQPEDQTSDDIQLDSFPSRGIHPQIKLPGEAKI